LVVFGGFVGGGFFWGGGDLGLFCGCWVGGLFGGGGWWFVFLWGPAELLKGRRSGLRGTIDKPNYMKGDGAPQDRRPRGSVRGMRRPELRLPLANKGKETVAAAAKESYL